MRLERMLMRTEEQDWQDLEKKLNPKTVDCRTGVCKYRQRLLDVFKKPYVFVTNKIFHIKKG